MPKLGRVSGEQVIRALERMGFERTRQRGSHVVMKKQIDDVEVGCVVPLHSEIATGTLRGVLKQAGVTVDEFTKYL